MKKSLQLLSAGFVLLLFAAGVYLAGVFPVDSQPYIEKKYAGWNGVLQAWVCSEWKPGGSFISWLNSCASEFEKKHDGVYFEFIPVQNEILYSMPAGGVRFPDLIFFSPGVLRSSSGLTFLSTPSVLRADLRKCGNGYAIPIALGGYIWAYNASLSDGAPRFPEEYTAAIPNVQNQAAALVGLLSTVRGAAEAKTVPNNDIDLGLPVSASVETVQDAFDLFTDGVLPFAIVGPSEIEKLSRLRENGRGPDWRLSISGNIACSDLLLYAAVPTQRDEPDRITLATEFISFLLDPDQQSLLSGIGAFSVTGQEIHSGFSVYAPLDELLNSHTIRTPNCFSEYSVANPDAIVRGFFGGDFTTENALSLLGFE